MIYVTRMDESCHTHEWVMSHIWMSHVTPIDESVTHMNESCHTCECVMSHIRMSHVTPMDESNHMDMCIAVWMNTRSATWMPYESLALRMSMWHSYGIYMALRMFIRRSHPIVTLTLTSHIDMRSAIWMNMRSAIWMPYESSHIDMRSAIWMNTRSAIWVNTRSAI